MTLYYIDFNRGNDANLGTAPGTGNAWQNLSKANFAGMLPGDAILLASDSNWVLPNESSLSLSFDKIGTEKDPIIIGAYDTGFGGTPTIDMGTTYAAGSWTYSAPNNAWTVSIFGTVGAHASIRLGGTSWGEWYETSLVLPSVDGAWAFSGSTLYLYAPSGTNPEAYYGSVKVAGVRGVFNLPSGNAHHLVFQDIQMTFGKLLSGFMSTQYAGEARKISVVNCSAHASGSLAYMQGDTVDNTVDFLMRDCNGTNVPTPFVVCVSSGSINRVKRCKIYNNRVDGINNESNAQGAIYMQCSNADVHHNDISGCQQFTSFQLADGPGIYIESGCQNAFVHNNIIHDQPLAFIDNSGRTATFAKNFIYNCAAGIRLTDENNANQVNHNYLDNTHVFNDAGGSTYLNEKRHMFWSYESTIPAMNVNIIGNIAIGGGLTNTTAIEVPPSVNLSYYGNKFSGFSEEVTGSWAQKNQ